MCKEVHQSGLSPFPLQLQPQASLRYEHVQLLFPPNADLEPLVAAIRRDSRCRLGRLVLQVLICSS